MSLGLRAHVGLAFVLGCFSACIQAMPPPPTACDGMCACAGDGDCGGATPRCDRNTGACVPCLPLNDNCPKGQRCVPVNGSFVCTGACTVDADCPRSDAGTQLACCSGACLDTSFDTANCGSCGKACAAVANAAAACVAGACAIGACDTGFADCDHNAANGCEASTTGDLKNCGACGKVCPAGPGSTATCTAGACAITCAPNQADCDKNPANGCEVSTQTDASNCGACGAVCGPLANAQSACMAGACAIVSCNPTFFDCNGKPDDGCEVSADSDLANCGACGKACSPANAVGACMGGNCTIASCKSGFANCDGILANGCEVAIASDVNNCGACSHVCSGAHSLQACQMGACMLTGCLQGWADCDMNAANGCEVSTAADVKNCGGCGQACAMVANGTPACMNAQCGIGTCTFGYAHCTMNVKDGCETNIAMDVANCGQCGSPCMPVAHGMPGCKTGMCGIATCDALWGDCDGNAMNGCEKSLAVDAGNCGKCGNVCSFANAMAACLNGQCGVGQCNMGFADCDMKAANGCEVNTNVDPLNCGKCGMACPMNAPFCDLTGCTAEDFPPIYLLYYLEET